MNNEVAIIFEWENWWAIEGSGGFGRFTKKYDETCLAYWKALMALGIEADVISANDVSDKYKFIIAPMFFMLTEKASDLLVKYVENGGSLLGTYMTGYVNENCLCFEGGFPGRDLGNLFGVKSEEIDTLYPNDKNGIRFIPDNEREMILGVKDYAELLRTDDVRVLGTYTDDFYKDYHAITVKKAGKGKAYYQAARCDDASLLKIMEFIVTSEQIAYERLPFGVEKHIRYSEDCVYTFYLNNSNMEIELKDIKGENLITGDFFDKCVNLMPKECIIVKNKCLIR